MSSERIAPSRVIRNPYHYSVENPKVHVRASKLLHGALDTVEVGYSRVRPVRFLHRQIQAMTSCQAWYPGIFRQMTRCTSGISVEFETDCSFVTVELRYEDEPRATTDVLDNMLDDRAEITDACVVEIDGQLMRAVIPEPTMGNGSTTLKIDIEALLQGTDEQETQPLQLFSSMPTGHTVRIWLPCLHACELGEVSGEGGYIRPVERRPQLLVLGDSVAQGFCAVNAAENWPCVVARGRNMDLVNQSVGAQVFQHTALAGLDELDRDLNPETIIVALGTNYRYEPCQERVVKREIELFLQGVDVLWPNAKLLVLIPDVSIHRAVEHSCYKQVPEFIEKTALALRSKRVAEGRAALLISHAPVLPRELCYDKDGHPTTEGHALMAQFMHTELDKLECRCLQQFGKFGQCGACVEAEQPTAYEPELQESAMDEVAIENNEDDAEVSEDKPFKVARLMRLVWDDTED